MQVHAHGLRYDTFENLMKDVLSNWRGLWGTGHTWVNLTGKWVGPAPIEGGWTGEHGKDPTIPKGHPFQKYATGVGSLLALNLVGVKISPLPSHMPYSDPESPVAWLFYKYKDGHWQEGHGTHRVTVSRSWCLRWTQWRRVQQKIQQLRGSRGEFSPEGPNCTSVGHDIAKEAGILLDAQEKNLRVPPSIYYSGPLPGTLWWVNRQITLRELRTGRWSTFSPWVTDKMADTLRKL